MTKILTLFLIFFLNYSVIKAVEFACNFEEVYPDGSIQNGLFLIKNQKMRYEYFDKNLYTIFKTEEDFYLVNNKDTEKFQKIPDKRKQILNTVAEIANDYPNIDEYYETENVLINIEKSNNNFFKRISIVSDQVALSIYMNNCENKQIENRFFYYFPYFNYK